MGARRGQAAAPPRRARKVAPNRRLSANLPRRRRARIWLAASVPLGAALVFAGLWGTFEGDLFLVREITFRGLVHAHPQVLVAESGLARPRSLFDDLSTPRAALLRDPLVRDVRLRRRFPSRLIVEVDERRPVAYWSDEVLLPVDAEGRVLPLHPAHYGWDLPILMAPAHADGAAGGAERARPSVVEGGRLVDGSARALLRLVIGIRDRVPEIARRVSVAELTGGGRVVFHLMGDEGEVRLRLETPLEKVALLSDIIRDLELKRKGFESVDLSFSDQIVVRPVDLPSTGAGEAEAAETADAAVAGGAAVAGDAAVAGGAIARPDGGAAGGDTEASTVPPGTAPWRATSTSLPAFPDEET
ncbi:MAG: FtsQ-type POTRA domain-containing protein [Gemmatimonadetes bacterium]|nr:FtsQ-type POTRA domain-containing protein [Gemmatimonadota bacterium]